MTVAAAISTVISYTDNVPASDAGNVGRRLRVLQWLQETVALIRGYRSWRFLYVTGSCTIDSLGQAVLPIDFGQFGWSGGLFNSDGSPLRECHNAKDLYVRFIRGERNTEEFSMLGYDTTTASPKIQTMQVSGTLSLMYCEKCPTLADSTTLPADNSLQLPLPQDYHNLVVIPGVAMKSKLSKGDTRDFKSDFLVGLEMMCRREQPMQGDAQELPYTRIGW
jgi:hypothetical protein